VLLASPQLARDVLQSVADAGGGSLTVFTGRSGWQTTVNGILTNTALMTYNDEVQLRMDAIRSYYMTQLGLADSEIIDLPVLFEDAGSGAAAYNPGVVNMIPTAGGTTRLVIPDPEGPDFGMPAVDAWQAEVNTRIQALYTAANPVVITYADVFFSYHTLLGEAHCGTNTVRTPPAQDWWDD
jgi:protein-arginine deiminase